MFLVDTNIVSEGWKGARGNPGVLRFLADPPGELYLPVQVVGELRRGAGRVRARGDEAQADRLEAWVDSVIDGYIDRILEFDLDCAEAWGVLMGLQPQHVVDKQVAAIALVNDMIVVTRNVKDFVASGVETVNPFEE